MSEKLKSKGLEYLVPDLIDRNPENPRITFDEEKLKELRDSINEVGILVPLIVYFDEEINRYVLLDGERRLRCAKTLKLSKVPANIIAKPTRLQNILEMFNIHNVRIEWGPMEVAWKLQVIMEEFGYTTEKDLSRLTSLKPTEIVKAKKLLSYDRKYQDFVHKGPKQGGIKEDFLIELKPTINWIEKNLNYRKNEKNEFIDVLIDKHKKSIIKNYVKNFRDLNKIVKSDIPQSKVASIIKRLVNDSKFSIEEAYEESIKYTIGIKDIEKRTDRLINILESFDFKDDWDNETLIISLSKLRDIIDRLLKKIRK